MNGEISFNIAGMRVNSQNRRKQAYQDDETAAQLVQKAVVIMVKRHNKWTLKDLTTFGSPAFANHSSGQKCKANLKEQLTISVGVKQIKKRKKHIVDNTTKLTKSGKMHVTMHMVNNGILDEHKIERLAYQAKYAEEHKEKIRAYQKNYYETNATAIKRNMQKLYHICELRSN